MSELNHSPSRRKFIHTAAVAAVDAPLIIRCSSGGRSPNGRLNHACIGIGGMGWHDLNKFREDPNVEIAAVCDVDADNLQKISEVLPEPKEPCSFPTAICRSLCPGKNLSAIP